MNNILIDRKKLPYGGAEAVVTDYLPSEVKQFITTSAEQDALFDMDIRETFITQYTQWIQTTKLNNVNGLTNFNIATYSNGTTEAFDKYYLKNSSRRFRCFRGEYMYHMAAWRNYFPTWAYLDDAPLDKNDAVVVSLPFADTGGEHTKYKTILDQCKNLNVPVLVDCAYFGICAGIDFDFTHPAITDVTFSLSKFLPVAHLRIGMRLSRIDDDDSLLVMNKTNYTNRLGASVGLQILKKYNPDYIYNKYNANQKILCTQLNVTPSNTVIFGIDQDNKYSVYNRGASTNRLNLAKHLAGATND